MTGTAATMTGTDGIELSYFSGDDIDARIEALGALLHACVHGGAGVHFVLPFSQSDSEAFWRGSVLPGVRRGLRHLLVAQRNGRIAGSVQLDRDTPPNQPHRADVSKLLVHPDFRRQGIARALMVELEALARRQGRSLLTLDTVTGDNAEPLYISLGYERVGVIPGYSLHPSHAQLESTTVMYKAL